MLNYNIIVKIVTKEEKTIEMQRYLCKNTNLSNLQCGVLCHKVYEVAKYYEGHTEIYKVEDINGDIVETMIFTNKPTAVKGNGEQTLAQYMYRVAGTLD